MGRPQPLAETDPELERLPEQHGGVSDTDPSLRSTEALPKAPDTGHNDVDSTVSDMRTSMAGEVTRIPTIPKVAKETGPKFWKDCCTTTPEGARIIDFEKARDFLYRKMKDSTDQWSPTPELALAIAKNPGKEEPFSLGVFTPTPPKEEGERKRHEANLKLMIKYSLIGSGADPRLVSDRVVETFARTYKRNLGKVRNIHPEVRIDDRVQLTTMDILKQFSPVKKIMDGSREENDHENLTLYDTACRLFDDIPKILTSAKKGRRMGIAETEESMPEYFFGNGKQETDDKIYRDRFVALIMLLHKCGFMNMDDYGDISMDEETMPDANTEITRLRREILELRKLDAAKEILKILDIIMWSERKAINFLKTGEKMYGAMQKEYLIEAGLPNLDEADFLEDLKNKSPYELLEYAMDRQNPIDWRHQAVMLAFIGLQFIGIRVSGHYRNAINVDRKMRDTFLDKMEWEKDESNPRQLGSAKHTYCSNGRGDYSMGIDSEYKFEREMDCRIWHGISGREYHIRIVDEENVLKSKQSILFKILLRNSEGDPRRLFDLVRFTFVFANVEDFDDPIVRKDIYRFLFDIGKSYGMFPKLANTGEDINWENDTADEIYDKMTKERSSMGNGYFTLEDKTQRQKYGIGSPAFRDIKLVGRDGTYGTGMELQCHTLRGSLLADSKHEEAGHAAYERKKARQLLRQMNPSFIYPVTYLQLEAIGLLEKAAFLRKKDAKSELAADMERQAESIIGLTCKVEEADGDLKELKNELEETAKKLADLRYHVNT